MQKNAKDIKNITLFQGITQSEEVFLSGDKYVSETKLELQIKKQLFPGYTYNIYIFLPSGALFYELTSFGFEMLVNSWSKGFHICFLHVHNSYDF